jgi:hypothetical protein
MSPKVTLDTDLEDLALQFPKAVRFLTKRGVRCIRCGEPVWGTLGKLLEEDGIANPQAMVDELNAFLSEE